MLKVKQYSNSWSLSFIYFQLEIWNVPIWWGEVYLNKFKCITFSKEKVSLIEMVFRAPPYGLEASFMRSKLLIDAHFIKSASNVDSLNTGIVLDLKFMFHLKERDIAFRHLFRLQACIPVNLWHFESAPLSQNISQHVMTAVLFM